ncbi:MAG: FKBP-type peptidyl-prolyl cis-trans isomerase [Saprospiraceae bacterium]
MKKLLYFIPAIILLSACGNGSTGGGAALPMGTSIDSVSYAYGLSVSESLTKIEEDMGEGKGMDINLFKNGITEGVAGNARLTEEQMQTILSAFGQKMQSAAQEKSMAGGVKFLEENKAKEGVQVTPSGLQYKVIQEGSGAKPQATDKVKVIYTGKLIDGTVFDTSVKTGKPAEFFLNQVIPGWTEGVQLMTPGSKYEFYIPSNLGYGPRGSGQRIPPNAALVFDIEYLGLAE